MLTRYKLKMICWMTLNVDSLSPILPLYTCGCTWASSQELLFASGTSMSAGASVPWFPIFEHLSLSWFIYIKYMIIWPTPNKNPKTFGIWNTTNWKIINGILDSGLKCTYWFRYYTVPQRINLQEEPRSWTMQPQIAWGRWIVKLACTPHF